MIQTGYSKNRRKPWWPLNATGNAVLLVLLSLLILGLLMWSR